MINPEEENGQSLFCLNPPFFPFSPQNQAFPKTPTVRVVGVPKWQKPEAKGAPPSHHRGLSWALNPLA
jgi:hypothetical protein